MEPISVAESIKKHGIVSVLTLFIFLMYNFFSNRLDKVEEKLERVESQLYDCLNDKLQVRQSPLSDKKHEEIQYTFAIIPDKLKIKWAS